MPGEIEVDFSDRFSHDPDRVRIPVLAIVPIHTAQHTAPGLYGPPFQTRGQRLKLWDSSFKSAVTLRHGHTGVTRPDLDIHRECRLVVLLCSYT